MARRIFGVGFLFALLSAAIGLGGLATGHFYASLYSACAFLIACAVIVAGKALMEDARCP